ncbi:hypothetical protein BDW22DRAFT_1116267 [Trametopsis cervina]|nr:hypothetical protein BDW22DRAFT_1116267 [Trametopsis cervina]
MFARISLAAFTVAAAVSVCQGYAVISARAIPANCARTYTVRPGDTCDAISAIESVSSFQLAEVNRDTIDPLCDNLFVGEPLCLGIVGQDCTSVHQVVTGDTCATIATAAGIELSTLLANNPNVNSACTNIHLDEVLCIDSGVIPYTF